MYSGAAAHLITPEVPRVSRRSDSGFFLLALSVSPTLPSSLDSNSQQSFKKSVFSRLPSMGGFASSPQRARRVLYYVSLVTVFLLSFAGPVLVAGKLGGAFSIPQALRPGADEMFPQSIVIGGLDTKVQFASSPELAPTADKDFLLVGWFKFKKFPATGERMLLVSKSESGSRLQTGYALALAGDSEGPRPLVFLGDASGGRWYRFTELKVPAQQWVMFAVSLRQGRYLGLHVATALESGKSEIQLLGGYDLESAPDLSNQQPLALAPAGMMRFAGRLGPLGVFQKKELGGELRELLKGLSRTPEESPDLFARREVALWWTGGDTDHSSFQHQVSVIAGHRR